MNFFYKNIGLYDIEIFEVDMSKLDFYEKLRKITYKTNPHFLSLFSDTYIPTRYVYRGQILENSFIIRKRKYFFDTNIPIPVIKGIISEDNDHSLIKIEFTPSKSHIVTLALIIFFFLLIILNIKTSDWTFLLIAIPLIISISHYFSLKRSIQREKYEFERELNYIVKKNITPKL
jgi:hypothetical protein